MSWYSYWYACYERPKPPVRVCIDCKKPFPVSKYSVGSACPACAKLMNEASLAARRRRQRNNARGKTK